MNNTKPQLSTTSCSWVVYYKGENISWKPQHVFYPDPWGTRLPGAEWRVVMRSTTGTSIRTNLGLVSCQDYLPL